MSVSMDMHSSNKVAAHWARKLANRKVHKTGILDSGVTSGVVPEEDKEHFEHSGQICNKTFMLLDKRTHRATKMLLKLLKHKLREGVQEINIVPGLHTTLISVSKLADENYITIFNKNVAKIYDTTTTDVSTTQPPILTALSGLWRIQLPPNKLPVGLTT